MPRPRQYAPQDSTPAQRMRRSRAAAAARGDAFAQVRLSLAAQRALQAMVLLGQPGDGTAARRSEVVSEALVAAARDRGFPLSLSREEEMRLARLALGPYTASAFRDTGYPDAFLAGLAVSFAGHRGLPRHTLLSVARELAPSVVTEEGYRQWLRASPLTLARLSKLMRVEHALSSLARPAMQAGASELAR